MPSDRADDDSRDRWLGDELLSRFLGTEASAISKASARGVFVLLTVLAENMPERFYNFLVEVSALDGPASQGSVQLFSHPPSGPVEFYDVDGELDVVMSDYVTTGEADEVLRGLAVRHQKAEEGLGGLIQATQEYAVGADRRLAGMKAETGHALQQVAQRQGSVEEVVRSQVGRLDRQQHHQDVLLGQQDELSRRQQGQQQRHEEEVTRLRKQLADQQAITKRSAEEMARLR